MKSNHLTHHLTRLSVAAAALLSFTSTVTLRAADTPAPKPKLIAKAGTSMPVAVPKSSDGVIRIHAGASKPFTDSDGHVWLADDGFADGDTAERADTTPIGNTNEAFLYRSEHYGMSDFSYPVPNGNYTVKLHFAETYEGIDGPGKRVFSFEVGGHSFEDFDIWAKAGGPNKAYVESVPVQVTDGQLHITFTTEQNFPEINAIEIIPTKA